MKATDHAYDCGWHLDQYPSECDCSLYEGKLGRINIDRQLFEAMLATLQRKSLVFYNYAGLHSDKKTEDGDRKAAANLSHWEDCEKVIKRASEARDADAER